MAPSIKSTNKPITGKVNMSKIKAAGLIWRCMPPWAGPLFWQSVIAPPQMVPQELNKIVAANKNIIVFFIVRFF
jgi:hypothetical protein